MTTEERRRQLFAQPSAAKEVYRPDGHYLNRHIIVRGPDGLWHLYYSPMFPGSFPNSNHHATSEDLVRSEGVPVPVDLQDVMEDWPWARGEEWPKMRSRHEAIEAGPSGE